MPSDETVYYYHRTAIPTDEEVPETRNLCLQVRLVGAEGDIITADLSGE